MGEYIASPGYGLNTNRVFYIATNLVLLANRRTTVQLRFLWAIHVHRSEGSHNWEAIYMTAAGYWAGGKIDANILSAFNIYFANAQ